MTATGLNVLALGGMGMTVDGEAWPASRSVAYKGIMFSGIPSFALVLGYTNASWTLKCDLTCEYVCRLLAHMDAHGYGSVVPEWKGEMPDNPFIDLQSGYVLRALDQFPVQGDSTPWRLHQNYVRDIQMLKRGPVDDEALRFTRASGAWTPSQLQRTAA